MFISFEYEIGVGFCIFLITNIKYKIQPPKAGFDFKIVLERGYVDDAILSPLCETPSLFSYIFNFPLENANLNLGHN